MSRLIALLAFAEDRFPRVSGDEPVYEPLQAMIKSVFPA